MRQYAFAAQALPLANAHLLYEYFVNGSENGGFQTPKAVFVREVMKNLIENEEWAEIKNQRARASGQKKSRVRGESSDEDASSCELDPQVCRKLRIPVGHRRWDPDEGCFPKANTDNAYQKYRCVGKGIDGSSCKKLVRTYCACCPVKILCDECWIAHRLLVASPGYN